MSTLAAVSLGAVEQQIPSVGAAGQTPVYTPPPPPQPPPSAYLAAPNPYTKDVEAMYYMASFWSRSERQMRLRNIERQKEMLTDMERLESLVASLREQMTNSAAPDTTDVGKRAAEIEKMAHKVGEKMKQ